MRALLDKTGYLSSFSGWTLRNKLELDAIKIYFVLVTFRDAKQNEVRIGYPRLNEYSGVGIGNIKGALNLLVASHLIYIEREYDRDERTVNVYRIRGVDPYMHAGTQREVERVETDDF